MRALVSNMITIFADSGPCRNAPLCDWFVALQSQRSKQNAASSQGFLKIMTYLAKGMGTRWIKAAFAGLALASSGAMAAGPGDLLVAPTRVVMDGAGNTEVILNNIGQETATYRVSLEIKRMTPEGVLVDIPTDKINASETAALGLVQYSPRRITLPPNQPQVVRVAIRPTPTLPDGEYRVHMLFRAIPPAKPIAAQGEASGVAISITPIYGVTIPVIFRKGQLKAASAIANPRLESGKNGSSLVFDLSRGGTAVYPEVAQRSVTIPVTPEIAAKLKGPVTVQYIQDREAGGATLAEVKAVVR